MTTRENCETACLMDIGGREEQQNRVAIFEGDAARLLVLGDGAGAHEGGALAAQAVIDAARERFGAPHGDDPASLLRDVASRAHERIGNIAAERGLTPYTTCVLLYVNAATATWAHVGNSRLYRLDGGRLVERTMDHSIVELMRMRGHITEKQMRTHPGQSRLYEALGGRDFPEFEIERRRATEDDAFFLASDGLWENVTESEIEAAFATKNFTDAVRRLAELARLRGASECDNIAVAALRYRRAAPAGGSIVARVRGALGRLRQGRGAPLIAE